MGQSPDANLYYGLCYKWDELPDDIKNKVMDDTDAIIYEAMSIPESTSWLERTKLRGTFRTVSVNNHEALIIAGFSASQGSWGYKQISMPSPEELIVMRTSLRGMAAKLGLPNPDTKETGWYLESDFE